MIASNRGFTKFGSMLTYDVDVSEDINVRFESVSCRDHEHSSGGEEEIETTLRTRIAPKSNPFVSPPSFRTSTTNRPNELSVFRLHTAHVVNVVGVDVSSVTDFTPRVRACFTWSIRQVQWVWCPPGPDPGGPQYNSTSSMMVAASPRSSGCSDSESDSVSVPVVIRRDW